MSNELDTVLANIAYVCPMYFRETRVTQLLSSSFQYYRLIFLSACCHIIICCCFNAANVPKYLVILVLHHLQTLNKNVYQ